MHIAILDNHRQKCQWQSSKKEKLKTSLIHPETLIGSELAWDVL